jgi:nicotinamidase-related amidase
MIQPIGREELLALLLARAPERSLDAIASLSPRDAADLADLRADLAELALVAEPGPPPAQGRERLLAARPRVRRPRRPVLVVLDMLNDHLTPGRPLEIPRARAIVPALQQRIVAARARSIPILYVCDSHQEGDPDHAVAAWPVHNLEGTEGAQVWSELTPETGDIIVKKPTYSAFTGSTLARELETLGADEIILTGCVTEIGIQATAVDALQRGFVVTIPPDCQAGVAALLESVTLLTLSTMPPHDPLYMRAGR